MKTLAEAMREWAWDRDIDYRFDGFQELVTRAERLADELSALERFHGSYERSADKRIAEAVSAHLAAEAEAKHWQHVAEERTAKVYELEAQLAATRPPTDG